MEELTLQAPLVLPGSGTLPVQVVVGEAGGDGRRELTVHSRPDGGSWVVHATGVLGPVAELEGLVGVWPPAGAEPVEVAGFYDRAAAAGYGYGPAFQGLTAVWRHGTDLYAEAALPDAAGGTDGFGIHPALLDSVLHPLLLGRADDRLWLPFSWSGVRLGAVGATAVRVRLSVEGERVRVVVADPAGAPVVGVESLVLRPADPAQLRPRVDGLFAVEWQPVPATASAEVEAGGVWVSDLAEVSEPAPARVFHRVPADLAVVLGVLQRWLAGPAVDSTLVVVTAGLLDGDPDVAAVWGLVRSAQAEHPGRFALLDLDDDPPADPPAPVPGTATPRATVPGWAADEPELAVRGGQLLAPRLVRAAPDELVLPVREPGWRLGVDGPATVESVAVVPGPEALAPLEPGQVRIAVHAAGLNFRDVLIALGMYPDEGVFRGSEGAGTVLEVGPGVAGLSTGDRVMGLFEGAFAPVVVADARMLTRVPVGWGMRAAAGVPVAFLTAWYGLVELGRLRAGERVLIHAATGGVGMAAVQIARHVGAEVFATASPGKHDVLAGMGIDAAHRASSRDAGFESFGAVDVVLNSLTGELLDASARMVSPGGRFVEIGKTDLRADLGRPGVDYLPFDLVPHAGPDLVGRMLRTLADAFEAGALAPPRVTASPLARIRSVMRLMSQAGHVGKLVLDIPPVLDPEGTVLVTGGSGTVAGLVAEHLVRAWGVRRLLLASRSGTADPDLLARLRELGAEVGTPAVDVADAAAVEKLVSNVDRLTGVVHAAGVVDDAVLTDQTGDRLAAVWAPKAVGAANLDRATRGLRLAVFTVFSSAAGTLGSPGQANYAAANAWCDALVRRRRAEGLAGQSIGWGLWADTSAMTGHLSRADLTRMSRAGFTPLTRERGLALLDAATDHGGPHLMAVDLDPRVLTPDTAPAMLRALTTARTRRDRPAAAAASGTSGLAERLAGQSPAGRLRLLVELVRTHAATVLGHAGPDAVRADTSFKELGFDSLSAVELRNRLAAATGLRLPAALAFDHPDATVLAEHLRTLLDPDADAPDGDTADPVLRELGRLESVFAGRTLDDRARDQVARRLSGLLSTLTAATTRTAVDLGALELVSDDEMFELIDRDL